MLQLKFKNKQCHLETTALSDTRAIDWNAIHNVCTNLPVHELTAKAIQTILAVVDKHAPKKTKSNSMRKKLMKPWITTGILKSIKTNKRMYKTHFLSGNPLKILDYKTYASNSLNLRLKVKMHIIKSNFSYVKL